MTPEELGEALFAKHRAQDAALADEIIKDHCPNDAETQEVVREIVKRVAAAVRLSFAESMATLSAQAAEYARTHPRPPTPLTPEEEQLDRACVAYLEKNGYDADGNKLP